MTEQSDLAKIRWRCHRGMLELDLFLLGFFDHRFKQLDDTEQDLFVELLAEQDPTLFAWILGHEACPEQFQALVEQIRHFHEGTQS